MDFQNKMLFLFNEITVNVELGTLKVVKQRWPTLSYFQSFQISGKMTKKCLLFIRPFTDKTNIESL